ncbi:exo-poly-alpha-D-galacturonosidase [Edaphobacter acidisoli]|uniref:Exo-poly-alpha-D-galacturonosidase n=1 Tax=Edaphobacter acidisoli TaxID=2040573 RepID=A0A916W1Z6_9BACT|nr:glycosyl hydrolase family 28 protein [Edaphobacter acidisoli]GGA60692.1 exo-poly-alpha-D-galacturonosidase [Edaphobacter acidisoli]
MHSEQNSLWTRRQWLTKAPVTALAGAAAAGMLPDQAVASPLSSHSNNDFGARVYNVRDFGAKGDGVSIDTAAVQRTINTCAQDNGGIVLIPAGRFQIGSVELKSNVTLRIAAGGTLLGSADGKQYHAVDAIPLSGDTTLVDGNWALLYAVHAKNVTIEGPGTIDGQGYQFHSPVRGQLPPSGIGGSKRPYHVLAYQCEGLTIRHLDLIDCAYHSVRVIESKRVHMDSLYIHNRVNGNNDGFHFISAQYLTVSNCIVLSQDDACALFGSCQYVTITNSTFSTRWSVFRFGGGQVRDIAISNCVLHQVYGCPIKFQGNPGSSYENISFSNLVLDDVTGPIHVGVGPRAPRHTPPGTPVRDDMMTAHSGESTTPAVLRNVSFSNIHGTVTTNPGQIDESRVTSNANPGEKHSCIVFNCVGGATMENVSLSDVHLTFGGGGTAEDAARRDLPEFAGEYFMLGPMPAYGLYARGVRGLTISNVRLQVASQDLRPAVIFDNITDCSVMGLSIDADAKAESALRIINSQQVLLTAPRVLTETKVFLATEGARSKGVIVDGGDLALVTTPVTFNSGASPETVKLRS